MIEATQKLIRYGAYGVMVKDHNVLLVFKPSGPYQGLWDLPGGGIEFGEAPETTLKREFLEEVAFEIDKFELTSVATHVGEHRYNNCDCHIHHVGIIYTVTNANFKPELTSEGNERWFLIDKLNDTALAPLAKQGLKQYEKTLHKISI